MSGPRTEAAVGLMFYLRGALGVFIDPYDERWPKISDSLRELTLAIEVESAKMERERIASAVTAIQHPCHEVCVGPVHADCQCAAWIRQEALRIITGDTE